MKTAPGSTDSCRRRRNRSMLTRRLFDVILSWTRGQTQGQAMPSEVKADRQKDHVRKPRRQNLPKDQSTDQKSQLNPYFERIIHRPESQKQLVEQLKLIDALREPGFGVQEAVPTLLKLLREADHELVKLESLAALEHFQSPSEEIATVLRDAVAHGSEQVQQQAARVYERLFPLLKPLNRDNVAAFDKDEGSRCVPGDQKWTEIIEREMTVDLPKEAEPRLRAIEAKIEGFRQILIKQLKPIVREMLQIRPPNDLESRRQTAAAINDLLTAVGLAIKFPDLDQPAGVMVKSTKNRRGEEYGWFCLQTRARHEDSGHRSRQKVSRSIENPKQSLKSGDEENFVIELISTWPKKSHSEINGR